MYKQVLQGTFVEVFKMGVLIQGKSLVGKSETALALIQRGHSLISDDVVKANNDAAVWLSAAYQPSPASAGVSATAAGGASPYPMLPYMGTLHTAIGGELSDFLQGNESAEQALADIEAAYSAAAKEKGFLK